MILACSLPVSAAQTVKPPNIIIIIADDLGWRDVGYHGSEIRTPHLDRLANDGLRLERHYVYPTCSPTRAGLLTGRNPSNFGILAPIAGRSEDSLPKATPTLAGVLKSRGYTTGLIGKWHLGLRPEAGPRQYGFDHSYGYLHGQIDQYTHRYKNGDRSWHRSDNFIDEPGHATDLIADESVRFIQAQGRAPFFLWVSFSVPHTPLQEEETFIAPYRNTIQDPSRRLYAASVTHMDAAIGRLLKALEQTGQIPNTLILFTSDNGGQEDYASKTDYGGKHGPYARLGDNRPLQGWKGELYEGGIRVPALLYWKDRLAPRIVDQTVSYLDWFPTLAPLAGADISVVPELEGRNIWPLLALQGEIPRQKALYWNTGAAKGLLDGDWKLIIRVPKREVMELYNLANDPAEQKNLAETNKQKTEELCRALEAGLGPR